MENYYSLTMDSLPQFILGGVAEFVLSEKDTKSHIAFRVKRDSKEENKYWVRYKSVDWVYIGYIDAKPVSTNNPLFYPLKLDRHTPDETIIKADIFRKFVLYVYHLNKIPENLDVLYTGRCCMCNRELKDPIYIKIGIGKICLQNAIDNEEKTQ